MNYRRLNLFALENPKSLARDIRIVQPAPCVPTIRHANGGWMVVVAWLEPIWAAWMEPAT